MKKNIVVIEDSSKAHFGGGQRVTLNVIEALNNDDFKIFLLDCNEESLFQQMAKKLNVKTYFNLNTFKFLFSGLGMFGTATHSSEARTNEAWTTFEVFLNSPFIGYSLGGVAPAIAELKGFTIYTQSEAKNFEGMNIFLEVLAASGIIGFIFFVIFFIVLYSKAFKIMKLLKTINNIHYLFIGSLSFALFMELLILSMNQNILRPYLWVLIGMLSASILVGKRIFYEYQINNRL